ncbi:MAG: hypothetical protein V4662_09060 [Verrucomicrobiota bacterium]
MDTTSTSFLSRHLWMLMTVLGMACGSIHAEDNLTPATGSADRTAICDAVRVLYRNGVYLEGQPNTERVVFVIHTLKVKSGWAFFSATPTLILSSGKQKHLETTHTVMLRQLKGKWAVFKDHGHHGDVIPKDELIPAGVDGFPLEILPDWQE